MLIEKALRKHVAIIHAYSMMSALQRKIVNVLLFEAMEKEKSREHFVSNEYLMSFSKLAKAVSFNSNNTKYLKEAIDGLASLKIEWNLLKDKAPANISFFNLRVLHGSPTFYQNGMFNFSFHQLMLDLVGNPGIYGTIDLSIQNQFESKYGHSLYENSTRFVNLQRSKIIELNTFRKLLGVRKDKYSTMRELTRNVIIPALEEVNDRADFVVNIQNIREGRKITGFEIFAASKKKNRVSSQAVLSDQQQKSIELIKQAFGNVSKAILEGVFKSYSEHYILEKITYVQQCAKKDALGYYPVPYFIAALRDDYKSNAQIIEKHETSEKTTHQHCPWHQQSQLLEADLKHWQHNLEYAKTHKNHLLLENSKKIILKCEERLSQHLLERPKEKITSETN